MLSMACLPHATAKDLPTIDPNTAGLSSDGLARLDASMLRAAADREIPGGVVLVGRRGGIAHLSNFGMADRDTQRPMRHDDIFRIYSMTKPVVSVALLTLYEEGRFQLDDPLELYIPEFKDLKVFAEIGRASGRECVSDSAYTEVSEKKEL